MIDLEDITLNAVAMAGQSAEEQLEARVDWLVRELDELCAMANNSETQALIATQSIGIGQVRFRAELILSFLEARKPPQLRVVRQ